MGQSKINKTVDQRIVMGRTVCGRAGLGGGEWGGGGGAGARLSRRLWNGEFRNRLPVRPYLRLGEAEGGGQFDALRRGKVALDLEALLQAGQLRIGEDGARFPTAAVLARQLGVRVWLEEGGHRHHCMEGTTKQLRGPGDPRSSSPPPRPPPPRTLASTPAPSGLSPACGRLSLAREVPFSVERPLPAATPTQGHLF